MVTLLAWLPLLSLVTGGEIASLAGCQLDEGSVHPCLIAGLDLGSVLNTMTVAGWLLLVTGPVMLVTTLAWAGLGLWWLGRWVSRMRLGK